MAAWSRWKPFPDPRKGEYLSAPFGPGVYELRRRSTMIRCGKGANCAERMSSLLPKPFGCGTRDNSDLRLYLLQNLAELEYRCLACESKGAAAAIERKLLRRNHYLFHS